MRSNIILFGKVFLGTFVFVLMFNLDEMTSGRVLYHCLVTGLGTALLWVGNGLLSVALTPQLTWLNAPFLRLLFAMASTLVYTFLIWWVMASVWYLPTKGPQFYETLAQFEWGDFLPTLFITTFISIFMHGRSFLQEWKVSSSEAERLKKEKVEVQYEVLKNQVNPHFLFNSLNVLTTLVHKDADLAEQFVRQLAAVYRYVLESRDREVVSLEEELKELEAFVFLMKIRFGDSFSASLPQPVPAGFIPPLTLQMLLENALKHNEVSKANPLAVVIEQEEDYIVMRNNIQPKKQEVISSGVGLENIRSRYLMLSDAPVITQATDSEFVVKIPILYQD